MLNKKKENYTLILTAEIKCHPKVIAIVHQIFDNFLRILCWTLNVAILLVMKLIVATQKQINDFIAI